MKKLLIAFLLISSSAHAEKYFEMKNKAGGKIVLHSNDCPDKKKLPLRMATSTGDGMPTLFGCWGYIGGEVHIVFDDGDRRAWPADAFTFVDTDK